MDDRNVWRCRSRGVLVGCEKETAKPAPRASATPPTASTPPATPSAPVASAPERKPVRPCPEGSSGKGTFDDPCKAKGKKRIMDISWDKKIGDKGPTFKIINDAKLEILYGKIVVYFYDKAGKQMNVSDGDKPRRRLTCAGDIFAGPVKAGEKVFMNFSCVKKEDVPKDAKDIEGGDPGGRLHGRLPERTTPTGATTISRPRSAPKAVSSRR